MLQNISQPITKHLVLNGKREGDHLRLDTLSRWSMCGICMSQAIFHLTSLAWQFCNLFYMVAAVKVRRSVCFLIFTYLSYFWPPPPNKVLIMAEYLIETFQNRKSIVRFCVYNQILQLAKHLLSLETHALPCHVM